MFCEKYKQFLKNMTKPECSKQESSITKNKPEKDSPSTAKDLFADFVPEGSDSEEENEIQDDKKDENIEPASKKSRDSNSKKYIPKYKKEWENKPELKSWLSESIHGNTYFYCKFCKKDYRCGISDIHKHMSSKKHALKAAMPAFKAQKFKFRGLLCPVFTPFTNLKRVTPDVNLKVIPKYANFLKACNIKGILINDIVGEGMSLTTHERIDLADAWADACEKTNQFLMAQIGGAPLKDVIEMAKHAAKRDIGAVVVLPDLYNKPKNHLDLIKYIKLISEFTENVPILYHHNFKFTQVEIDITSFLLDITGEVDSFVGVIYSTNDIQQSTAAMAINREKFTVFMGTDEAILGAAASGFTCIMGTSLNFLPKLVESICEAVREGNIKNAQTSQNLLNRTIDVIVKQGDYIAASKAATDIITSTCGTTTREPLQTLWEGTIKKLQCKLRELGVM
ncbi:N-acetylneuraminate lyase-like [Tribolium madens]|uniref:N-acetylneuraminate lyase-like n=1 Tax=Tribolium madens TaxID=41895 RepID=UPI001CF740E0|nr:N-acetylneuraminate lyase-like [Tribolium madens]